MLARDRSSVEAGWDKPIPYLATTTTGAAAATLGAAIIVGGSGGGAGMATPASTGSSVTASDLALPLAG